MGGNLGCAVPRCLRTLHWAGYCQVHYEWRVRKGYTVGCQAKNQRCVAIPTRRSTSLCNFHRRQGAAARRKAGRGPKWSQEQLEYAKLLLEDGASYRETSRSSGVPRTTLREKLPGYGWTMSEGGQLGYAIARSESMKSMQREIGLLRNETT